MGLDEFFMPFLPNQTTRESNLILVANNELVLHCMKAYYALNADIKAIATEATIHTRTALAEHKSMEGNPGLWPAPYYSPFTHCLCGGGRRGGGGGGALLLEGPVSPL